MTHSSRFTSGSRHQRQRLLAALLLALLLPACMGNDDPTPTATIPPTETATSVPPTRPAGPTATATKELPDLPVATLTPDPTATTAPTATPPSDEPDPAGEIGEPPPDQVVDLPEVELAYEIVATLEDFDSGIVEAVSTVTVTSRAEEPIASLFFRVTPAAFREFSLNGLERDGEEVEPVGSDGGTTLEIPLDPPLEPGATTALRFGFTIPIRETGDGFASISRDGPVLRLGYWYPMLSNDAGHPPLLDPAYTLSADFDVTFTAPADVVVAAAGELSEAPESTRDGTRYRYTLENGRDFAMMLSPEFELDERTTITGITVRQYTIPALYGGDSDLVRRALRNQALATAERALGAYAANIGDYPWPALTIVEGGPGLGGGIEYSALTIISYDAAGLDILVAHEIAHMWFYAAIGTRTQLDPWIDEGAATFLAGGLVANDYGATSDQGAINYVAPLNTSIVDLTAFNGGEWITAIYIQGGSFYADTYRALGDDAFWDAMRALYEDQAFAIATPWEVLTTFQAHSPTDLDPLYERYFTYEWLDAVS